MNKHQHIPVDPSDPHLNICNTCGLEIIYDDTVGRWYTEPEVDEWIAEQQAEAEYEWEAAEWEALHPESRCPPRE